MLWVVVAIISVLILLVLVLLVWLIISISAGRRETAGQAAGIGLLQQQLEALKAAQDKTTENLQKSLQAGQNTLTQGFNLSSEAQAFLGTLYGM